MVPRARLSVVVALLVAVVLAGCLGGGSSHPYGEQVREDALGSMEDVETYAVEMTMRLEADDRTVRMEMTGEMNRTAERGRMDMTLDGRNVEIYIDGTTMYANANGHWRERDISDRDPWDRDTALERQRHILESADIREVDNRTLDGTPVTVLEVDPDEQQVMELLDRQGGGDYDDVTLEDLTYRQYVSDETGRLLRVEMDMTLRSNGEQVDVDAEVRFFDFDEPTDITIPREARRSLAPA